MLSEVEGPWAYWQLSQTHKGFLAIPSYRRIAPSLPTPVIPSYLCSMYLRRHLWSVSLALAVTAVLTGCASTGAPLPPSLELPRPPSDLRASRKGDKVTLAWTVPTETTDHQTVRHLGPTRICRSKEPALIQCGTPVAEVSAPKPSTAPTQNKSTPANRATYVDTLPLALRQEDPTGQVTYAVAVLNANGRSAGLSNQTHVSTVPTLPPPTDVKVQVVPNAIEVTFSGMPEQQPLPEISHRYRIYRREEGSDRNNPVGEMPLENAPQLRFVDRTFEWEKTYEYRVTVVTILSRPDKPAVEVEGDDSSTVKVASHHVFPPAVPAGLQEVYSGEGQQPFIDLVWAPDTDADLAGYNVYRREDAGPPIKLNTDLVKTPAYRDNNIQPGKRYLYSVSAVDLRGNESQRSEEASEEVPETHVSN